MRKTGNLQKLTSRLKYIVNLCRTRISMIKKPISLQFPASSSRDKFEGVIGEFLICKITEPKKLDTP